MKHERVADFVIPLSRGGKKNNKQERIMGGIVLFDYCISCEIEHSYMSGPCSCGGKRFSKILKKRTGLRKSQR